MPLMKWGKENFYLKQEYLSDIELYISTEVYDKSLKLIGDEFKHASKVMRHKVGDTLHVTNGDGKYFNTTIIEIDNDSLIASINNSKNYLNEFENVYFCFPRLKSSDRFEFELEKSIELGITNFIIINTQRTIPKGEKLDRWKKISLAAMKQSLRTFIPKIEYIKSIEKLNYYDGQKIILDQKGDGSLIDYLKDTIEQNNKIYYIFGPEGGLAKNEIDSIINNKLLTLTENRLRAETAVISTATAISLL